MIPYLLAVVGGYLLGDSIGEDIDKKIPEFADGVMADGGVMAKGGEIKVGDIVELENGMEAKVVRFTNRNWVVVKTLKKYPYGISHSRKMIFYTMTIPKQKLKKMADGGIMEN